MAKPLACLALAFISSLLMGVTSAVPAGAAAGMDLDLIRNIKNYVMPMILHEINTL